MKHKIILWRKLVINLNTKYMGLNLKNPIIAASGPLTSNIDGLKRLEDAGVGAVVIKSIFQEQIDKEAETTVDMADAFLTHSDAYGFLKGASEDRLIDEYLTLIQNAKKSLDIPIIASLNGMGNGEWIKEYAPRFAYCGADAFEINHYEIGSDAQKEGRTIEKDYIKFAKIARKEISLPLSLKIGSKFSSPANMIKSFDKLNIDALVLFNRFYHPDINIDSLKLLSGNPLSDKNDYTETLRWVALMSDELNCDLCANNGIHNAQTIIKMLLSGAKSVELCSVLMKEGVQIIDTFLNYIVDWMGEHNYNSISDFNGILAQERMEDTTLWERTQYVKTLHSDK